MRLMDFSDALYYLKANQRVARQGWNGQGMWVQQLSPLGPFKRPLLVLRTADGFYVPWAPDQDDLLHNDWALLPSEVAKEATS